MAKERQPFIWTTGRVVAIGGILALLQIVQILGGWLKKPVYVISDLQSRVTTTEQALSGIIKDGVDAKELWRVNNESHEKIEIQLTNLGREMSEMKGAMKIIADTFTNPKTSYIYDPNKINPLR